MNILLTSATSALGGTVAAEIGESHHLRLTDRKMAALSGEFVLSPLGHDVSTNLLVRGMDALIVVGEPLQDEAAPSYIDAMTRGLYNLLWAAHQEQVTRVVYLSTLDLMTAYGPEYIVTERWRPRPTPEPHLLGKHLGEYVCREFAREHKLTVVVLRLGTVVSAGEVMGQSINPMWLDQKDLGSAVQGALTAALPHWNVIHVQGKQSGARFPVGDAEKLIGFAPVVDFSIPSHMH
jgi:nucleoside-diphosphate-sugar epimerase